MSHTKFKSNVTKDAKNMNEERIRSQFEFEW